MTDAASKPASRWWKYLLALAGLGFACSLALSVYINTDAFQALLRRRLVAEIERITGGRAEVGSFHTIPFRLQVEVRNITVHGRESATDIPLAHVDSITARLKFSSLLRSELAFYDVILDHPVVRVAFYPDGNSNIPNRAGAVSGQSSVEKLFELSINHVQVRNGQVNWDDQTIPLDLNARDMSLGMDYSYLRARYDGHFSLGWVDTKLRDCRPFAWSSTADFNLGHDSVVFTSLKWNSAQSKFLLQGQINNFRHPHFQAVYDAHLDLTEGAAILRRSDLRDGVIEFKGDVNGALEQFTSNGHVSVHDLAWRDERVSFSKASLVTDYSVSERQLKFTRLQGKIFGGSFTGDAEVNDWLSPDQRLSASARKALETAVISAAPPLAGKSRQTPRPKTSGVQNARISIRFRDLSAEDTASAFNAQAHPIPSMHLAGLASGTLETLWKGTRRDAELHFTVDATPPAHMTPEQLALNAHAEGVYYAANDKLDLPQFQLSTPTSHVQASGTLSSTSALRLSVSTSSLEDWLPFVQVVRGPALVPVALNGRAVFTGNLTGAVASPQLGGKLQVDNFEINIAATSRTPEVRTRWDSLSTSIQLSFDEVAFRGANLRRAGTSAEFDASASLQHGHFTGDSNFKVRANLQNTSLAVLQSLVGYNYPITGTADVFIQATGTGADLHGDGKIHLNNASAYGESVQQFDSNFHFSRSELAFDNMHLFHDGSVVTGSAAFNTSNRTFNVNLAGSNIELVEIHQIQPDGFPIDGRADFTLSGSGNSEVPAIQADIHIRKLSFDHELSGDVDLHAVTQGGVLHVSGSSQLSRGTLQMTGDVQLTAGDLADLSFRMHAVDLDALWRYYLGDQLTDHSAVSGSLRVSGPAFYPSRWIAKGDLNGLSLEIEKVKLHNQEPVHFTIANQSLDIQQLRMLGQGTDLAAHGTVHLSSPYALGLAADGNLDLNLLSTVDSNFAASGSVSMNMTVGGIFADPLPDGRLQVNNGAISYASLPSGLSGLGGTLLFTRDRIYIETLTARTGGGSLGFSGDASYLNHQLNFNLTANGKDVRLRYPPGVSSTADAALHWVGTRADSSVTGDILINKIAVTPGFDFGSYLDRSRQISPLTAANSGLYNIKLDIHVQTSPELQMRTAIARLSGDADLHLRGSAARPAVLGRVDVFEGQATFHGTRYTLERGDITFANPVSIEPQLNLQASTHVRNHDLNITVTGTPDRGLNLNYRSEPPLPKSDIIALLALGRTGDESAQLQEQSGQSTFNDQATNLILNQALDTTVSNRLQRLFGASNIRIDPQGLVTETNPVSNGPQITIEQEFANNISLTYSTNVSQSSEQIIQGEYYINRNLSIVGQRDQNDVVSFDVQVRRRKK